MNQKSSYSKEELLKISEGIVFGPENGKLPTPPMLMVDRITHISAEGGKHDKGEITAELDIDPKQWFFDCHFVNDPVMPGCLGLDGFWQLVGFFLSWSGGKGRGRALGVKDVKFKGQIRPYHDMITYQIDIKKFITRPTFMAWADGSLRIKDKAIYFAHDLQVGLFEKLVWDTGMDPSLDPF
ncbi:MAG: bifunctional 3-hydroxydecanoyl-ACP dehydratase/trans-2-decenoyl-ACP isomerase [Candidatus Marinimicrobia bacterium]|jgi:3-hydroxyacyl-[acyl-carrier protein] dehydratase/trans-2-decenoyl-[acyl-carrier protein] isomerase|nr:bifunctional 3-hydroxydecanoyl-ACP dehydratase/trans-2-decenoyl-ACP isomerase [Candidatus Neomarinimicrobiota bacterium]MDP6789637.1 bifunctional 3-hydroxydecanoyl-ACP dehydratase/trans-2-decenoyl-ACP isomerase [Candidatus Neomarinimicrobiota bacterium]MDP7072329.1 bifunctional 3-hydroxydecanoyl-ACP dehydratase/trans-2-decenoyl-ACP isomerase [Candidatus Neomarinimicrobiota bacterium]|tara:strand:- start:747 stop:1292 length:546 start_codon:yes stop_codon:yes gene_type:complete